MGRKAESVGAHMTTAPLFVQVDAELSTAVELMQQHEIRHLPVLDGERLVGIVSERDLGIIESLVPDEWERIVVAEAMTPSPYAVPASTPLAEVAKAMADQKYGCVVVTDKHGAVAGLFTTTDALRVLASTAAQHSVGQVLSDRHTKRKARSKRG